MGIRKNAKLLTATEKADLVRAFVMMKADPVPGRPYNWFDAFALIHRYIQNVTAPDVPGTSTAGIVNFGHGGAAFGPWHRYFLLRFEQKLQSYVPGVSLPYWDWTDPSPDILVANFMGPNGSSANGWQVRQGYFAATAPGGGGNTTPLPGWWPAGLTGWTAPAAWGVYAGALRRSIGNTILPPSASIGNTLSKSTYATFRRALESGVDVIPTSTMHAAIHAWFNASGANAQMRSAQAAALDPMFYLHHTNVDRLWAMWQADGNGNAYGGAGNHHRLSDPMYPWVGTAAGYSPNNTLPGMPALPNFSGDPVVRPADVFDHLALGYSYDTLVSMAISLDGSGSMLATTPNPMTGMGDVSKWEAATQGVSAFLQDCEAAYESREAYVSVGIKTFRSRTANEFTPVFAGRPYGLVKNGSGYSRAVYDAAIATQAPDGGTPLADALLDAFKTLTPPLAGAPADERRYLALFTDGTPTTGTALESIRDGSLERTAVFAMGFGHPGEVAYRTLDNIIAKGAIKSPTPQTFHGDNAGQIDRFFSDALAEAVGYTPVMSLALELFDGEHTHLEFSATSAEAALYMTLQGMDFEDEAWSFQLMGPDGAMLYADGCLPGHAHGASDGHGGSDSCHCVPQVTARRSQGRLTLFVQRNNCAEPMWAGQWMVVAGRRAQNLDAMVMVDKGALLFPVVATPARGPRYARLLQALEGRTPARIVPGPAVNALDEMINSTNRISNPCAVVVNVYARTGLRFDLGAHAVQVGDKLNIELLTDVASGSANITQSVLRILSPQVDLRSLLPDPPAPDPDDPKNDTAHVLARLEAEKPEPFRLRDEAAELVSHHGGAWHYHVTETRVPGPYHFGLWIRGTYDPGATASHGHGGHTHGSDGEAPTTQEATTEPGNASEDATRLQHFERILSVSTVVSPNV
ncbi:MAG TPA: tyrosinase family protein [Lysobacter sp.]|nr:tyrosinase family protein [Lysobacter sp.]